MIKRHFKMWAAIFFLFLLAAILLVYYAIVNEEIEETGKFITMIAFGFFAGVGAVVIFLSKLN